MTLRNFSSTAVSTTLAGGVTATGASMTVGSTTGFPAAPFTVIVDKDTTSEEVCEVTALSGLLLTVTRGIDGTTASAHSAGAGVIHGVSGRDFSESNTHVNTSSLHVPSQSGAAGMFVRSDGTTASWQSVAESDVTGLTADLAAKAVVGSAVPLVDGVAAAGSAVDASHEDHVHPTDTSLAPLASPTFTGTPAVPTATTGTNTTQAASTAFVLAQLLAGLANEQLIAPTEKWTLVAAAATGTINFDCMTQGVLYYTNNASANWTLNFRGDATTSLATLLAVNVPITVSFLNTNGATAYYPTAFQIDGTSVTPKWSGGTAPSAGNASAIDAYQFTIIKTAATPTYTVLAAGPIKYA